MNDRFRFFHYLSASLAAFAVSSPCSLRGELVDDSDGFEFRTLDPYNDELPEPEDVLGRRTGEFLTDYGALERLIGTYAPITDRLKVQIIGRTPERRPLYLLAISSPENLARLDEIRAKTAALTEPRLGPTERERRAIFQETPVTVWLGYTIHGDESAGTEAATEVIYELLASESPKVRSWLDRCVVLINPCQNPDGHERFVSFYNGHGLGRAHRMAYEHQQPWAVISRYNHNNVDLNRDMVASSQPESRAAMRAVLEWNPQVVVDLHGETREYFFPPVAMPYNPVLPVESYLDRLDIFGRGNAAAFDLHGWIYYNREIFDIFYPGYWDSWTSLQGASGMTYETDGGGSKGLRWLRDDKTVLTLREGIARHFTASLATIDTAATNRVEILEAYQAFFSSAISSAETLENRFVFLLPEPDPEQTARLVALLLRNGVEVDYLEQATNLEDATNILSGKSVSEEVPAGAFLVDLAQPRGRIARAFLQREIDQDESFIEEQLGIRKRNDSRGENAAKEAYEFYDVTAWCLSIAFGVKALTAPDFRGPSGRRVHSINERLIRLEVASDQSETIASVSMAPLDPEFRAARSAYVFRGDRVAGIRLCVSLLGEGFKVASSVRPLGVNGKVLPPGSLILHVGRNPERLHQRMAELSFSIGVGVEILDTAYANGNGSSVGSEFVEILEPPHVAVATDQPVGRTSFGEVCAVLENGGIKDYVPIATSDLDHEGLSDFNVLILPDGDPEGYSKILQPSGLSRVRAWCEAGGTLICLGRAVEWAARTEVGLSDVHVVGMNEDTAGEEDSGDQKEERPKVIPGAFLAARVNQDHWLSRGLNREWVALLKTDDVVLQPGKTGTVFLTYDHEPMVVSGFVWPDESEEALRGSVAAVDETVGSGRVVLFAFNPGFRRIWQASDRLLLNAVLYGPAVD